MAKVQASKDIAKNYSGYCYVSQCVYYNLVDDKVADKELKLRIDAVFRRMYGNNEKIDLGDGFVFDVRNKWLLKNGETIHLKAKVAELLDLFIRHKGEVLSKEKIFDEIYDFDETPNVDSLRTFIKTLRNILGNDKIETIKEVGYRFVG